VVCTLKTNVVQGILLDHLNCCGGGGICVMDFCKMLSTSMKCEVMFEAIRPDLERLDANGVIVVTDSCSSNTMNGKIIASPVTQCISTRPQEHQHQHEANNNGQTHLKSVVVDVSGPSGRSGWKADSNRLQDEIERAQPALECTVVRFLKGVYCGRGKEGSCVALCVVVQHIGRIHGELISSSPVVRKALCRLIHHEYIVQHISENGVRLEYQP